jgi:transcription termination factor Rho
MPDNLDPASKPKRPRGRPPRSAKAAAAAAEPAGPIFVDTLETVPDPASALLPAEPLLAVPEGKRVIIGITGEPGAGKSALARQLIALGGQVIGVDEVGHGLLDIPAIKRDLVLGFGEGILGADGAVQRRELAALAFATPEATAKLNAIIHPRLSARVRLMAQKIPRFAVIDASLLHELGLGDLCTITIYVKAHRDARIARVSERGWDEAELARREAAIGNSDERRKKCQLAVDNSGDPAQLAAYAKIILARQLGVDLAALKKQQQEAARMAGEQAASSDDEDDRHGPEAADEAADSQPAPQPQNPQPPQQPQYPQRQGGQQRQPQHGNGQGNQNQNGPNPDNRPPVKLVLDDYLKRNLPDLQAEADKLEVRDVRWLKKHDLICEIIRRTAAGRMDELVVSGYMEIHKEMGYIRSPLNSYLAVNTDTFIGIQQLRRYGLKPGMHVIGTARAPRGNEKCPQLLTINTVMGEPENKRTPCQDFEHLIPLHAHERLFMELPNDPTDLSLRIFDLACPIGKGQRGLIVAQPKCGKTVYLQKIANAITTNNPECELMVLLVDERPEEVTDMQRSVKGEVIASTFDQPAARHVQCAEVTINKAKRLVERGKDVVILLDSITRLARAYNAEAPGSGRVMSGGIESTALIKPKQFFGAARKIEGGGSLTILATALVDTGSLADTVIFEEFKGTGNMELVLDRRLADRRVFPAINIASSGTRKDDLLIHNKDELVRVWALRRFLAERSPQDAVEFLRTKLKNYKTNVEFLLSIDPEKVSGW